MKLNMPFDLVLDLIGYGLLHALSSVFFVVSYRAP